MKQRITIKQLNELSDEGRGELTKFMATHGSWESLGEWEWTHIKGYTVPLLSIGQMIEFLDEIAPNDLAYCIENLLSYTCYPEEHAKTPDDFDASKLCDALWEAVKEVLGK